MTHLSLLVALLFAQANSQDRDARRKQLADLLDEQWEYTMRTHPEYASVLGDKRYNDKISDRSEKAILAEYEMERQFLARFKAVDTAGFPEQEALNKALMVRERERDLEGVRFKVDTGFHYKKWTRKQVVDYFHANSGIDEPTVQGETDRYMAWPGQALGYKIGQLKILDLRDRAKKDLGSRFDIRGFHDEVLGGGAMPLDVLEQRLAAWTARNRQTGVTGSTLH